MATAYDESLTFYMRIKRLQALGYQRDNDRRGYVKTWNIGESANRGFFISDEFIRDEPDDEFQIAVGLHERHSL